MACALGDIACWAGSVTGAVAGSAIENLGISVNEMVGQALASMGTVWVYVGTPNLSTTGSASSSIAAGESAPGAQIATILNYVTWIGLVVAAISLLWLGVLIAASLRRGEGGTQVGKLGLVLGGAALIGASGALIGGLLPASPNGAAGATLFLQSALWWYMGAMAVASVIVAGARMAWEQRADPGKELLQSLFTLIVVAGASVTITQMALTAADSFSVWLLRGSIDCDVTADTACFGDNLMKLWDLANTASGGPSLATMVTIVLGLFAALTAFLQILVMLARAGIVVILAGVLPLSAAATNTESGRQWFRKTLGWLIAWVLYKPAAAIVYATAFQLVGTNTFSKDDAIVAVLTGLMLMLLALVALPVLLRLVTPAVGAVAGGGGMGGALGGAAMASLPMGAVAAANRFGGGGQSGGTSSAASGSANSGGGSPGGGGSGGSGASPVGGGSGDSGLIDLRDSDSAGGGAAAKTTSGSAGAGAGGGAAGGGAAAAGGGAAAAGPAAPVAVGAQAATQAGAAAKASGQDLAGAAAGSPSGAESGTLGAASSPERSGASGPVAGTSSSQPSGSGQGGVSSPGGAPGTAQGPAATGAGAGHSGGAAAGGATGGSVAVGVAGVAQGAAQGVQHVVSQAPQAVAGQQDDLEEGPSGSR